MKNEILNLRLFGEAGAESAAAPADSDAVSKTASEETVAEKTTEAAVREVHRESQDEIRHTSEDATTRILSRLAAFWELDQDDADTVFSALERAACRSALEQRLQRRCAAQNYAGFLAQAQELSQKVKGFDLRHELSDRRFCAMLRAGVSVEDAWRCVHFEQLVAAVRKEAAEASAKEVAKKISNVRARPDENGVMGQAGISRKTSAAHLSGGRIREILRRVENGAKVKF